MSEPFTIDRNGREYNVNVIVDEMPSNPRTEYDHSATRFYICGGCDTYVNELDGNAGSALRHFGERYGWTYDRNMIERAFHLWTVVAGSSVRLVHGQETGYVQGDWLDWYALVDTDVIRREGYGGTPESVATAEASEYAAYVFGDVYGVVVTSPEGEEDSLWGVVDRDHYQDGIGYGGKRSYVREVADEIVDGFEGQHTEREALKREQANLVGAGFVGVI